MLREQRVDAASLPTHQKAELGMALQSQSRARDDNGRRHGPRPSRQARYALASAWRGILSVGLEQAAENSGLPGGQLNSIRPVPFTARADVQRPQEGSPPARGRSPGTGAPDRSCRDRSVARIRRAIGPAARAANGGPFPSRPVVEIDARLARIRIETQGQELGRDGAEIDLTVHDFVRAARIHASRSVASAGMPLGSAKSTSTSSSIVRIERIRVTTQVCVIAAVSPAGHVDALRRSR